MGPKYVGGDMLCSNAIFLFGASPQYVHPKGTQTFPIKKIIFRIFGCGFVPVGCRVLSGAPDFKQVQYLIFDISSSELLTPKNKKVMTV